MTEKTRDEIFHDTVRHLLQPGETLQYVALGQKRPAIGLIILLVFLGVLPGMVAVTMLTKNFLVALTDRRVIVARAKGIVQVEGWFDYPLGNVGGEVTVKTRKSSIKIAIAHLELPFEATFLRSGSPLNLESAQAIADALAKG
ncbi:MAG TPA: hypothetical protein VHS96_18665 [Bacteroidia bacterium]|nr:hypothetical protein [Bacteroidia bacterium]